MKIKSGRPLAQNPKLKYISFRVTDGEKSEVVDKAAELELSITNFVRQAIKLPTLTAK
jgi:uncharacterized protein (DUF1778 family)